MKQRTLQRIVLPAVVVVVVVILAIVLYQKRKGEDNGTNDNVTIPQQQATADTAVISGLRIYFSNTYGNDQSIGRADPDNIDRHITKFIAGAGSSLDAALFEIDCSRIADALIAAHQRGVAVRLVSDSDYRSNHEMQRLLDSGIPVVFDERSALMHNKFLVADNNRVWTGSYNATDNGSYRNNNNALEITSGELAENYRTEFTEMFERHEFGPRSESNTPHTLVQMPGGMGIYNYFSAEDDVAPKVVRLIKAARGSIRFMTFSFSDNDIGHAIIGAHQRGVDVEGVFEKSGAGARGGEFPNLQEAGIPVMKDGNRYVMHHKVIVIDSLWTITGSYNFSASAAESNDENILLIRSRDVALKYLAEYQRIRQMAREAL